MNDKQYTKAAFIGLAILLLWWLAQRKKGPAIQASVEDAPSVTPEVAAYASNPSAFGPASLSVTIGNQGLGYLDNKYMPLFGFVGMADGVYYG